MSKKSGVLSILKRRMAVFVVIAMIMTMVLPYMGNVGSILVPTGKVYADGTELQPESLPQTDSSSVSTSYKWTSPDRVDFRGKRKTTSTYDTDYFTTRFGTSGWYIDVIALDGPINVSSQAGSSGGISFGSDASKSNGYVTKTYGIEIKVTTKPSADKKYILMDLYAYNTLSVAKYLNLRIHADTQVVSDSSRVVLNKEDAIIHMVYDNSSGASFDSFDIINRDANLKLDPFNVAWAGGYSSRNNAGNAWYSYNTPPSGSYDSGASLGWKDIYINPYEIVHRRVAVLTRTKTVYVNATQGSDTWTSPSANNGYPGAYDRPYATVAKALTVIGNNKGCICIQTDCDMPNININNANKDITIQSSDLQMNGRRNEVIYKLKTGATNAVTVSDGSITFQDIIVDGENANRTTPVITQTNGNVTFSSGAVFKNIKNTNGAAVIDVTGNSSKLNVYGVEIDSCISSDNTNNAAITYKGANTNFEMNGVNKIWNNKNSLGTPSNVYLADGRVIQVTNYLKSEVDSTKVSRVSIRSEKMPEAYIGNISAANQEIVVAEPTSSYPGVTGINNCPFEQYFEADLGTTENRMTATEGKYTGNVKNVVLCRPGNKIMYRFRTDTGSTLPMTRPEEIHATGEYLTIATPATIPEGYELNEVRISGNGLTANNDKTSPNFGQVTGAMGTGNVTITYVYKPKEVKFIYIPNGALQTNMPVNKGYVGRNVSGFLPVLTKYAYIFKGWFTDNYNPIGANVDYNVNHVSNLVASYSQYPNEDVTLYAKWAPGDVVFIPISEKHTNIDNSFTFWEGNVQQHNVEDELGTFTGFDSKNVPGYTASLANSVISPSRFLYRTEELDVGQFTEAGGVVSLSSGYMPAAQTTVNFKYGVNTTVTKPVTVKYFRRNGGLETPLDIGGSTEVVAGNYYAEQEFSYDPPAKAGYSIADASIISGDNGDGKVDTTNYLTPLTGNFEASNNYRFVGKMPNQPVELKYIYELTAGANTFSIDHMDASINDTSYQLIRSTADASKVYEDALTAAKQTIYGYTYDMTRPDSDRRSVDPVGVGTFDNTNDDFTGNMPLSESVTVTYNYQRDLNYFKNVLFKPSQYTGCTNYLAPSGSPDMEEPASGNFRVQALTNIGGTGWTFAELRDRNLIPTVNIDDLAHYETVGETGFFIDANDNGLFDNGETDIAWNYVFTGEVTIVPHIQRIVNYINITLTTNGNGNLVGPSGTIANTYTDENTWADVTKPTAEGYYFRFLGWYLDDIEVQDTDLLTPDGVYVAKFVKDTSMQDALKKVLYNVKIDDEGNGVIAARDVHTDYIYVVTDLNGDIKKVKKNGTVNDSIEFTSADGIEVNTKYNLYEVSDTVPLVDIESYTNISEVNVASRSELTECYVPAVIKNYTVTIDSEALTSGNKNVARLTIKPTSANYEYALYKDGSLVPGTDWTTGDVTGITFYGLEPGTTYNVVTKRGAVETTDKGTVIYIDALNELTENVYAVAVINGTVNGENSALVKAGDRVNIETTDNAFVRWQALNGNLAFANANSKQTSFIMPDRSVVVVAKEADSAANLKISSVNYSNDDYKVYLDNSKEGDLIDVLATDVEKYLSEHNFKIGYRVTYTNDILSFEEENALKSAMGDAARGAVAIDVSIDRYLDNQRVDVFNEILPIPTTTSGTMSAAAVNELHGLYGDSILNKVKGLNEYIDSLVETTEESTMLEPTVNDEISSETTIEEEAEEDEATTSEETTTVEETTTTEETTTASEEETTTSEETTTVEETTTTEETTTASEEATTNEESTTEESITADVGALPASPDEGETETANNETVAGFSGGTEITTEKIDYAELLENLILFGSSFPQVLDLRVNTYVVLPKMDLNNGEYKVYKVEGASNLTEIPCIVNSDAIKEKGIISFLAEMDARYIVAYNKYNIATFINENYGAYEQTGIPEKTAVKVKYGDLVTNYTTLIPASLLDYEYERAHFTNGVWSYKNGNREVGNLFSPASDEIITPITLYALYNTDRDSVQILIDRINDALERAKLVLENYFLLKDENTSIKTLYDKLVLYLEGNTISNEEAEAYVNELVAILDVVEPKLDKREADYNAQNDKNIPADASRKSTTGGGSRGGGGGGGGGGGSAGGAGAGTKTGGGPGAVNPLEAELSSAMQVMPTTQNLVTPTVTGAIASTNGSVLAVVSSDVSVFIKSDGTLSRDEWVLTNNGWYHTNPFGSVDTGWRMIGPKWYHFEENNSLNNKGKMSVGWVAGNVNTYYTSNDGDMVVGYQIINGKTYYFNANRNDPNLPMGALLKNIATPDGRFAGADGEVR